MSPSRLPADAIAWGVMEVGGPWVSSPRHDLTVPLPKAWDPRAASVIWMSVDGDLVKLPHTVEEAGGGRTTYRGKLEATAETL